MIKSGVDLRGLQPQMVLAYVIAAHVYWTEYGAACVITSGKDGEHMVGSLHYEGLALDLRVNTVPQNEWMALKGDVAAALGQQFYVELELGKGPHLHVEFDPKDKEVSHVA